MKRSAVLVAVGALLGVTTMLPAADAETAAVAVDRQSYTTDLPAGDPCAGTEDICVSTAGGTQTSRAFVHINVEALPSGATIDGLALNLVVDDANSAGNAGVDDPSLQACVLTEPLPADPQEQGAPEMDCEEAAAAGEEQADGSWRFDLTGLVRVWERSSNTGAAIVPADGDASPAKTWSVAFLTTSTTASATFTTPALPPPAPTAAPQPAPQLPPSLLAGPPVPLQPRISSTRALIGDPVPLLAAVDTQPQLRGVIVVRTLWLLAALAVAMLALGMLAGATLRNVRSAEGSLRPGSVLRGLAAARSQTAVAFGLLAIAAMVAVGAAGHAASVPVSVGP